jgi:hypothetical protein
MSGKQFTDSLPLFLLNSRQGKKMDSISGIPLNIQPDEPSGEFELHI